MNYATKLKNCRLANGILTVPGASSEEIEEFGNRLRKDILSYKVPHWKVIGVKLSTDSVNIHADYITKIRGANRSYAELLSVFSDLIYAEADGDFDAITISSSHLNRPGFLMGVESHIMSDNNTLFWQGKGMNATPKALVKNLDIIRTTNSSIQTKLIIERGTGVKDFAEISSKMYKSFKYVPVGTAYDLTSILSIKMYMPGDTNIFIRYKKPIEEEVLEKIIRDYAEELEIADIEKDKQENNQEE